MSLSSSSLTQIGYIAEVTPGVTPGSGTAKGLRMTGETLALNIKKEISKEIEASRQTRSLIPVSADVSGAINIELSVGEYDELMSGTLMNAWGTFGTNGLSTAALASFTTTTLSYSSAPTGADALSGISAGQWVRIVDPVPGTLTAGNARVAKVLSKTTTDLVFAASTFTLDATPKNVQIQALRLTHGTTKKSYSIERQDTDINQFFIYKGCQPGKMMISLDTGGLVTGSFDFIGLTSDRAGTTFLPSALAASQTGDTLSSVTGVIGVYLDGVDITTGVQTYVKKLTMTFDNKLQGLPAIGSLGNVDIMIGTIELMGDMEVYFANGTLYDDFVNNVHHSLTLVMQDSQTLKGYAFTVNNIQFEDAKPNASAKDQPMMLPLKYRGLYDSTTGKSLFIDAF